MNRINTVENKVLQILRDSPETRYEDMKLYYPMRTAPTKVRFES